MLAPLKMGPWKLVDLESVPKNGLKVFSCFHCGGGSTMGYKLAGFDVLGGIEIDPEMMAIYRVNHKPRHSYLMGVQEFAQLPIDELPSELFNLDVLDGSPPCSSFSTAGLRHKAWGDEKKFREGQAKQVLDDLFFHYIAIANKLRPKVVVAENVRGLITGKARGYVKEILVALKDAGYSAQLFLLNASRMGVPQRRERTVFVAHRSDLVLPSLKLMFDERPTILSEIKDPTGAPGISRRERDVWDHRRIDDNHFGEINRRLIGKPTGFTQRLLRDNRVCDTLTASDNNVLFSEPRKLSLAEILAVSTFPIDYDFGGLSPRYVCGMSVPPFMMQRVAREIYRQWFLPPRSTVAKA
jgi:DNA (cytosine-5)-methyltransferase 1